MLRSGCKKEIAQQQQPSKSNLESLTCNFYWNLCKGRDEGRQNSWCQFYPPVCGQNGGYRIQPLKLVEGKLKPALQPKQFKRKPVFNFASLTPWTKCSLMEFLGGLVWPPSHHCCWFRGCGFLEKTEGAVSGCSCRYLNVRDGMCPPLYRSSFTSSSHSLSGCGAAGLPAPPLLGCWYCWGWACELVLLLLLVLAGPYKKDDWGTGADCLTGGGPLGSCAGLWLCCVVCCFCCSTVTIGRHTHNAQKLIQANKQKNVDTQKGRSQTDKS